MAEASAGPSILRLAGNDDAPQHHPLTPRNADYRKALLSVAAENRLAAALPPADARWALAVHTSRALEGGHAAVLTPDARRRIVRLAVGMGLREFDANLVIAIVQDGVRSGSGPLSPEVESRLTLVRPAQRATPFPGTLWWKLCCAITLAVAIVLVVIRWLGA
ncbi:MAG: hypothetical protein KF866_00570 [Phycisphaeraceae bacterium]|nr:hypothetical protein [Phycisphaeraceae bacterium]MCW5755162.1 hypothetical protein [Phycisphaeraceae bacterium]